MWLTEVARLSRALKVASGPHLFELNYLASLFPEKVAASNREHTGKLNPKCRDVSSVQSCHFFWEQASALFYFLTT